VETTFNLKHIIDQIVKEKGIDRNIVVEALEQAVLTAANKKFRNTRDLEAHYNPEVGEVESSSLLPWSTRFRIPTRKSTWRKPGRSTPTWRWATLSA